ncbi:hypothetical protein BDW22DRAFT_1350996 [Trametopsis cervina]|nr:hypothetical protein BDW22DRAFT_1350996 [Trametopsis cervina]
MTASGLVSTAFSDNYLNNHDLLHTWAMAGDPAQRLLLSADQTEDLAHSATRLLTHTAVASSGARDVSLIA